MGRVQRSFLLFIIIIMMFIGTSSATMNVVIITDPTGQDPNGAAAGSMSFEPNMFQSTFIFSRDNKFAVLSGGLGTEEVTLASIVSAIALLEGNSTAADAASVANNYQGARIMVGGPQIGAAVGGSFDAYVVTVKNDTITVTPASGGLATLEPGEKGAIIHLRNSQGNPMGTAPRVRQETAIMIGKMIRDGYSATDIMGKVFEKVAKDSGERYGGGAVNLASGVTTGDMFTPQRLNETGYPMDEVYSKICPKCGWSIAYPAAENYYTCPLDGSPLKNIYAYEALRSSITVTDKYLSVSIYGTDAPGVEETTQEIVDYSVQKNGYNSAKIAEDINEAISDGLLVGVNYVEPKDINIKENIKAVGVYYKPLPDKRSSPPWNLPLSPGLLDIMGNVMTAIGLILVVLVMFRSTLIKSFIKK